MPFIQLKIIMFICVTTPVRWLSNKELVNTRLASGHGGWVYFAGCGENIGYLCYVTYDSFRFSYRCKCGGQGIAFEGDSFAGCGEQALVTVKNRLCCPSDQSPLFTILPQKLKNCKYEVVCTKCKTKYAEEKYYESTIANPAGRHCGGHN